MLPPPVYEEKGAPEKARLAVLRSCGPADPIRCALPAVRQSQPVISLKLVERVSTIAAWIAAEIVLTIHVLYVAFVVLGLVAVVWGAARGWGWVRNPLFRLVHLGAILVVAVQAIVGKPCPLTIWERDLRAAAGQNPTELDFIPRLFQAVIFFEFPPEFFLTLYLGFAAVVALTLLLVPPRRRLRIHEDPLQID